LSDEKRVSVPGGQGMPTRDVMKDDFGWEIPVESVPVPSKGKVYPHGNPLSGMESLEIYGMTAKQEDILTSRALIKKGTVITHLLKSCLVDKNIDVDSMLLGDRNALMVAVRITGYGSEYMSDVVCPACTERVSHNFNLGNLGIKRLTIEPAVQGENLFEFQLPVTNKKVRFRFLTGRDETEINVTEERKKKAMPGMNIESGVTARLSRCIVSVGDVTDPGKISMFVNRMPAKDSRALRSYMDDHEPGIDMKTFMTCPSCGESSHVGVPVGINFFWPER
tara:strand:- start:37826 stop:38662 length:837 start_codon:yes stop_codon:yes gene_type:complete